MSPKSSVPQAANSVSQVLMSDTPVFSPEANKLRNRVERFFNKISHFQVIAKRFDEHDANFIDSVKLAALRIWMRFNESVT